MPNKKYRPNVAIFVLNSKGQILTCERTDYPGTWQLPQGGIDKGERPKDAAVRELYEEIGTNAGKLIAKVPGKFRYDWPKTLKSGRYKKLRKRGYFGQEQVFYIFRLSPWAKINLKRASKKDKELKQEFQDYEFLAPKDFLKRINSFKKETYKLALTKALSKFPEHFNHGSKDK